MSHAPFRPGHQKKCPKPQKSHRLPYQFPARENVRRSPRTPPNKPKSRPRKLLTAEELKIEERRLKAKYPHIVKGTLLNVTKGKRTKGLSVKEVEKFEHKRSCLIACQRCTTRRRVATSDLAQVTLCTSCTRGRPQRSKTPTTRRGQAVNGRSESALVKVFFRRFSPSRRTARRTA